MAYKAERGITVDGKLYDVDVLSVSLDTEFIYKYAERTEDYNLNYELGGVFFNQSITIGYGYGAEKQSTDFSKLWKLLSSESNIDNGTGHNVKVWTPLGRVTFLMYPDKVTVALKRDRDKQGTWWESMTVNFIGVGPHSVDEI